MVSSVVYIFALSLLVAGAFAQVLTPGSAACREPAGFIDSNGVCNCYSGYAPSTPDMLDCNSHARCAGMLADAADATGGNQPLRPTSSFSDDHLTIVQKAPIVSNRKASEIRFLQPLIHNMAGNNPGEQGADTCFYPGILWTKTVDSLDCMDVFTAVIPWVQSKFCGFVEDSVATTAAKKVLKTTVVHQYNETYAADGQKYTRVLSSSYLVTVTFATQQSVSSNTVTVTIPETSLPNLVTVALLGNSIYDVASGLTIAEFRTTAMWPYELADGDLGEAAFKAVKPDVVGLVAVTITQIFDDGRFVCTNDQDTKCVQGWRVTIAAEATTCDIQGLYTFSDVLLCRDVATGADAGACPVTIGSPTTSIDFSFHVAKTELCAAAALDTSAQNDYELTPYFKIGDSDPTYTYQSGDMIYFQLKVVDPMVTLESVKFSNIVLYKGSEADVLFDGAVLTSTGTAVSLAKFDKEDPTPAGKPAILTFQYQLLRSALPNTVGKLSASSGPVTVEITTSVTFDLAYHGNNKRDAEMIHGAKSSQATQTRTIQLIISPDNENNVKAEGAAQQGAKDASVFDELTGSASINTFSLFAVFVALFVAAIQF